MTKKKNEFDVEESLKFIIKKMATGSDIDELKKTLNKHTETLNNHTETLNNHTQQLNNIQTDLKTMRDKRMQLEVRVNHVEKHLHLKPPVGTVG